MLNLSDPTHEFIYGASEIHAHRITLSRTYMGLGRHRYMQKKKSLHDSRVPILSIIAKFANVVGQSPGGMWQLYKTGFCLYIILFFFFFYSHTEFSPSNVVEGSTRKSFLYKFWFHLTYQANITYM